MGQRYRFNYQENADVLDASFWIEDNNELASEFNGYLDRDNIAQATIAQNEIRDFAFTAVDQDSSTVAYTPDKTSIGWQGGAGNDANGIFQSTQFVGVECLLVVEAGLTWVWDNGGASSYTGSGPTAAPWTVSTYESDCIQFRITVDGSEVARTGLFDDVHQYYGTSLVGAIPVVAGEHIVAVECSVNRRVWETLAQTGPCTNDVDIGARTLVVTQELR